MTLNDEFLEDWNWHNALGMAVYVDWETSSEDGWEDFNNYWDDDWEGYWEDGF